MISVLDYGLGNLGSVMNMLKHIRIPAKLIGDAADILEAEILLLPGVGAFDAGMDNLEKRGFIEPIQKHAIVKKAPILGICLGAQLLMESSEEGALKGLGLIPGKVRHFSTILNDGALQFRVPHMGWSQITTSSRLFDNMDEDRRFYFVHSYYLTPEKPDDVLCTAHYGENFVAGIQKDNITGVQFHPEKSHQYGMQFFRNFYDGSKKL